MLRRFELGFVVAAGLVAAFAAHADVYKYTDAKGNVEYTDKPHALPAERLNIQTQKTDQVTAQTPPPASKPQESTDSSTDSQPKKKAVAADDKEAKCAKARERYDSFMNSGRLYQDLGNGERRYLTDQELESARTFAKTSMDVLCK